MAQRSHITRRVFAIIRTVPEGARLIAKGLKVGALQPLKNAKKKANYIIAVVLKVNQLMFYLVHNSFL